ncbi:MAG: PD-(D/E)XK nuclease family protein [Bifidobacteriaceae bacterium]|jgi:putative RecB family exonuclease|nr:PD-(D/E)XK nuclease family protein [Bifidobacteriaceae bacterium]
MEHFLEGKVDWDVNSLGITDEELQKKAVPRAFSPSASKASAACMARFALDRFVPRPFDPLSPADIGTIAHSIFEELFNEKSVNRTRKRGNELFKHVTQDALKNDELHKYFTENPDDQTLWRSLIIKACSGLFTIFNPSEVEVIGTEEKLYNVQLGGVDMIGYIDLLLEEDESLVIWDYKTGKYMPEASRFGDCEHDTQQRLYFAALICQGRNVSGANLAYTSEGKARKVNTDETKVADDVKHFAENYATLLQCQKQNSYPNKTGVLCGWCPYVKACPAAQMSVNVKYSRHALDESGDATGKAYNVDELF